MGAEAPISEKSRVVVRFAGDSGDGMQLTGSRFTTDTALYGNDLRTLPDFPAEIRAPAGSLAGVSAFQICFSSDPVFTQGDWVDVLVAMNPAALKTNSERLRKSGAAVIANIDQFTKRNLQKAGYENNPLESGELAGHRIYPVDISTLTAKAVAELRLPTRTVERCKNFFSLGLIYWLYDRDLKNTLTWIEERFGKSPELAKANALALKAGYYYGETTETFESRFHIKPAKIEPGLYRNVSGNQALAWGFIAASHKAKTTLFQGSYPITPASDILHELSRHKGLGVQTFQAEDEIAAMAAAIGASYGGALAITSTSGPGIALKAEGIGLAVMLEVPVVVIDVQRGGPSTGLPTKTEQADLLQAIYGRNSEAPVPVLAAATPGDCFDVAFECARLALKYSTPVYMLSDGYIANGSEPWKIPDVDALPDISIPAHTDPENFLPYARDQHTLARPRVIPGTPGLEYRMGGLEKEHLTGAVSYDPENHELMVRLRDAKIQRITQEIPPTQVHGPQQGDMLLVGWGSTRGAIRGAVSRLTKQGVDIAWTQLRYLNPLPPDLGEVFSRYKRVVVPELNMGQLALMLRATTLYPVQSICKIQGQPFREIELVTKLHKIMKGESQSPFLIETLERVEEVQS